MARIKKRKLSKKELKALKSSESRFDDSQNREVKNEDSIKNKLIEVSLPKIITVKEFADISGLAVTDIISELMKNGVLATINDSIDFDTAAIVADDLGVKVSVEKEIKTDWRRSKVIDDKKKMILRPPVVTIMGHVDHGKTTLLDKIRKSHIVDFESGGITQHISAYQVVLKKAQNKNLKNKIITFIDTPGHAAFSALRSHGTVITDIIILIIAAGDGVMPQTKEVIEQAKINKVPIIVAINKIDLPDKNIQKIKQQLADLDLVAEDWGGKTVVMEISAITGKGVDELLEVILLQADLMELKADPNQNAVGVVIESHMHKGAGALAVVLIENGTLRLGDPVQVGTSWGKIRILEDSLRNQIKEAPPSFPARLAGLQSLPNFGDRLIVYDNEKDAKSAALKSSTSQVVRNLATAKRIEKEDSPNNQKFKVQDFNIILKSDVKGSIEAIKKSILEIDTKEVGIRIISEGVGPISESDVTLARATRSIILGFRVKELMAARKIAQKEKVEIKIYEIIYKLIDNLKMTISDMLPPEIIEKKLAEGKILKIFRDDKKGIVAGGRVETGAVSMGDQIKLFQDDNEKWRGKILSLRREKSEVKEVSVGQEFGFGVETGAKIAVGDKFEAFKVIKKKRTID